MGLVCLNRISMLNRPSVSLNGLGHPNGFGVPK